MSRNKNGGCAKRRREDRKEDPDVRAYRHCYKVMKQQEVRDERMAEARELAASHPQSCWYPAPFMKFHIIKSAHQEEQDALRLKPYNRKKFGMKLAKPVSLKAQASHISGVEKNAI